MKRSIFNSAKNLMGRLLFALVSVTLFAGSAVAEVVPVSGVISSNTTWNKANVYQLSGKVYVSGGATLTIEAGTRIEGQASATTADASALVITRGSKINATGTASEPIVFTAANGTKGGWGGLVLLGKAVNNQGTEVYIEGISPDAVPAGVDVQYGGTDNNDNSGVLSYVRVEYAGAAIADANELNSFTFGSVGAGTQLDHLQAYYGADDSFEFFGGNVNAKYLISTATDDDAFDFDFGYTGKLQFLVSVVDPNGSYSGDSNGIECDNNGTGADVTPYTRPVISNLTVVGTSTGIAAGSGTVLYGTHFRRATRFVLRNSVLYGYNGKDQTDNPVIKLNGAAVYERLGTNLSSMSNDSSYLANNVIGLISNVAYDPADAVTVNSNSSDYTAITLRYPFTYNRFFSANIIFGEPLRPTANPAQTGADFSGLDSWFDTAPTYKGAFGTGNYWIADSWVNKDFPLY